MTGKMMGERLKKGGKVLVLLVLFFLAGRGLAAFILGEGAWKSTANVLPAVDNWGLGFGAEGTKPTGNVSAEELAQYDAYYVGATVEKVIYLTFDCGYENGNTEKILAALKKHNVKENELWNIY